MARNLVIPYLEKGEIWRQVFPEKENMKGVT